MVDDCEVHYRKDNGVKPMDVDRAGVMISAKHAPCAKVEMTKVAQVNAAAELQAAKEAAAPKAGPLDLVESQARSLVLHETQDAAILAARALECKPFGAFSFVCRMLRPIRMGEYLPKKALEQLLREASAVE